MADRTDLPRTPPTEGRRSRADVALAFGCALTALAVYLATIYPGLTGIGDATKFAFVAKVFGIPHAPGYPLYIWTSHLFWYLPFGTLAYRMNVLSALWGASAVGLGYLIARHLGVRRTIAIATALALGFGNAYWSRALYAKGTYTLNATIVSVGVLALLAWSETRSRKYLLVAIAAFCLGLGNHLTILALVPTLVAFTLATDWRTALRPSTVAASVAMAAVGFGQYVIIMVRTAQHAPYLEARAGNLTELWRVMTAERYATEVGAFSWSTLLTTRVPIVSGIVNFELHLLGLSFIVLGLVVLARYRWRVAMLFGLGALSVAALTANMSSNEDQGFLLSVFVLLWPVFGVGVERLVTLVGRVAPRVAPALALVAAVALPADQLVANYRRNDHHRQTFETEYWDAFFAVLPTKTAIIDDAYHINMLMYYKLLGEDAARGREIAIAPADPAGVRRFSDAGFTVLAFDSGRADLQQYGSTFAPADLPFPESQRALMRRRQIYRLNWAPVCLPVGNAGWRDFTPALPPYGSLSIRVDNYREFESDATIYSGADRVSIPLLFGQGGVGTPTMTTEVFATTDPASRRRLLEQSASDGASLPDVILRTPHVTRSVIRVNDRGQWSQFGVDLGPTTTAAIGRVRVDLDSARRAVTCSHALATVDAWPEGEARVTIRTDASGVEFGAGWYATERLPDGMPFRWTADRASVIVPIQHPRAARVRVEAEPFGYPGRRDGTMRLTVNGRAQAARPFPNDRSVLEWDVPAGTWRVGLNQLVLEPDGARRPSDLKLSGDSRLLGASVRQLELVEIAGAR